MADTFTPNLNLTKPEVGASRDAWGGKWNGNADLIDAAVKAVKDQIAALPPGVPPGVMALFAMPTPPTGWLKANGAAVSRTTYAALFAAIGTTFGAGDGSTTFALPDTRGYFMRALDDGRGVDAGRVLGSVQADQNLLHDHPLTGGGFVFQLYGTGPQISMAQANIQPDPGAHAVQIAAVGGSEARPKNMAFPLFIKY